HKKMKGFFEYLILDECFPAHTKIACPSGQCRISDLRPGDLVYSPTNGQIVARRVLRTIKRKRRGPLVKVTHSRGSVTCTPNHKFWANGVYVEAGQVRGGDQLHVLGGQYAGDSEAMPGLRASVRVLEAAQAGAADVQSRLWRAAPAAPGAL